MNFDRIELFSKNKIQEAICQFTFKSPLDLNHFDEFSNQLKSNSNYTVVEHLPFFHFNINLGNLTDNTNQTQKLNGLKLSSESNDKVIQLFANNLSIHQVGNYTNWKNFREDIFNVLKNLVNFYDVEIARVDLRAINNFDFITYGNLKQYLNLNMNIPIEFGLPNAINYSIEQIVEPNKEYIATRATYNQLQSNFILDLNFMFFADSINLKTSDYSEIGVILDRGNFKLYQFFLSSISEEAKKLLK
jgi:uncharacterized protein (TIGR04255 family)